MDLLWTGSDGSEAIDGPAQVKAPEQKSQEPVPVVLVAHGVWPKSPNPREHPPVDQAIRSPRALVAWKAVYSAVYSTRASSSTWDSVDPLVRR